MNRNGKQRRTPRPEPENVLANQTVEGAAVLVQKLRDLIERIEENPDFRAASHFSQVVETRNRKGPLKPGDTFNYHTGRSEWHLKAILVDPVPESKRVEGGEYA